MTTRSFLIFLGSLMLTALLPGCSDEQIVVSEEQEILFEVSYVNYAWGYRNQGFFIDKMGRVWIYENPKDWKFGSAGPMTAAEMDKNLSQTTLAKYTVPAAELAQYIRTLKKVSDSHFTEPVNKGADMGGLGYYIYRYDPGTKIYSTVLLQSTGDFDVFNRDSDAKKISEWLLEVSQKIK